MISISQAVIVEGKYDKMKLASILDAMIIPTDGFRLFQDKEKCALLCTLAKTVGLIVLTDSDRAGRQIRNYIKSMVTEGEIIHLYIPEITGKEARKKRPSKEGTLGVEGVPDSILIRAFEKAGIASSYQKRTPYLTKTDLVLDGLSGAPKSAQKRKSLLKKMGLPQNLSANALLDIINATYTEEEYRSLLLKLKKEEKA